jgi:hypothetical protein
MKKLLLIMSVVLLTNCGATQIVNEWKNSDIESIDIYKILIVGMTSNSEAREAFESRLKNEFQRRGIEAVKSISLFDPGFTTTQKSKKELDSIENVLVLKGFDTVLFTKVIGVEDKIVYADTYKNDVNTFRKFKEDYLMYQDVYYNPDYYNEYTIYHTESSLYCICPTKPRELVWKGYIDITDPTSTEKTVDEYVNLIMVALEEHQFIKSQSPQ